MYREGEAPSEPPFQARTEPRPPGNVIVLASLIPGSFHKAEPFSIIIGSAHNHHITGIVWFDRFSHRLDRRGTTGTQGNK
jgi:hypothetical protein